MIARLENKKAAKTLNDLRKIARPETPAPPSESDDVDHISETEDEEVQGITSSVDLDPKKRFRSFAFTAWCGRDAENWDGEVFYLLKNIPCNYMILGRESCPQTNRKHFQCTIVFAEGKTITALRKLLPPGIHSAPCIDVFKSIIYCKKDGNFFEKGKAPMPPKERGIQERDRWVNILENARAGHFEMIDAQVQVVHARNLDYIYHREQRAQSLVDSELNMLWLYGSSGTGKSRWARENHPDAYLKQCNKWWDGYENQEVVIIEDFDKNHDGLAHHLKIWGDRYPFPAEIKGGMIRIRPKLVIVTSNYAPNYIWSCVGDLEPIIRRFKLGLFVADGTFQPKWDQPMPATFVPMHTPVQAPTFNTPPTVQLFPPELTRGPTHRPAEPMDAGSILVTGSQGNPIMIEIDGEEEEEKQE